MIDRRATIAAALERPANGFTLVRLVLALAVVLSHAFSVVSGRVEDEPLAALTGFTLGEHAVNGFFAVSGFLVTMSFYRRGARDYVAARALRIVPGFVAATLVVALGIGLALTSLSAREYLASGPVWRFILATLTTFKTNVALPGLFAANPFRFPMGTVWTLKYEVLCYAGVFACGLAGLLNRRAPALAVAGGLFVALVVLDAGWPGAGKGTQTTLRLAFLFAAGAALYLWRDAIPVSVLVAVCLTGATLLLARTPAYHAILFTTEAYGAIWLAFSAPLARPALDLREDLSYGVYLYGWPIQQALRQLWPATSVVDLLWPSLAISLAVAWLSWRLVERPALAIKARRLGRRTIGTIEPAGP